MTPPQLPDIVVPWDTLQSAAEDMSVRGQITAEYLRDAAAAWSRLRSFYQEPDTEERVFTALDDVREPLENWHRSLQEATQVISEFVTAGRDLERRRQDLQSTALQQGSGPEAGAGQDERAEQQLNEEAAALTREWASLQEDAAASLERIAYGTGAGLPMGGEPGRGVLPAVGWAELTSQLDDRFGTLHPDALLPSITGLNEEELREWAAANPEAAALLADRRLNGPFRDGTPEAIMRSAMADGAHLTEHGVAGIRSAWLALSPEHQERLMLLYPAVFGNLNGIPFGQRTKANIVTLAGYRQTANEVLNSPEPYHLDYPTQEEWYAAFQAWEAEKTRMADLLRGLDHAHKSDAQVVSLGMEGNGQVITMVGTPSDSTSQVATLVPGTGAKLGELGSYSERLAGITGDPADHKVAFYFQSADSPQSLVWDNASPHFNETGAPMLAAFDFALDLEIPAEARSTYVGYSAGGSLMGTAEREGLDSTNIVYVAPAGPGHQVTGVDATANPEANRYWVQTRDDLIRFAQAGGGSAHSGSFWQTGSPEKMGAIRLEPGFADPDDPDTLLKGHEDYFKRGSTAAMNIQGVIDGSTVSLFVEDEVILGADGSTSYSPIEANPGDYSHGRLDWINTLDLEK